MTIPTLLALQAMLIEPQRPKYPLEICQLAGLPAGSIYTLLARLEKAGWLTSWKEELDESAAGRRARRYYTFTPEGITDARMAVAESMARLHRRNGRVLAPGIAVEGS